jgi:predicted MFS family arabinose efflux permease
VAADTPRVFERRLLLLAAGAFVVASDGTLVVGLLRQIARALSASPAATGQAVTVFAAVYAIATPLLVRAARPVGRERLLIVSLAMFAIANAGTGASSSLTALLAVRVFAAIAAGVFMVSAAALAADTGRPDQRGRRLAVVVGGASAGTALGVPLGTFLSSAVGWRAIFYGIAVLSVLIVFGSAISLRLVSDQSTAAAGSGLGGRPAVLTLVTTLLWASGSFMFFTYIAIVLSRTAAVGTTALAGFLLLFGAAGIGGAIAAGWLTDKKGPFVPLAAGLVLIAAALTTLGVIAAAADRASPSALIASALALSAYGPGTWAITPPQQHRLLNIRGDERLLLALNGSALYAGVAIGSALGGIILATTGTVALCLTAAGVELLALASIAATRGTTGYAGATQAGAQGSFRNAGPAGRGNARR